VGVAAVAEVVAIEMTVVGYRRKGVCREREMLEEGRGDKEVKKYILEGRHGIGGSIWRAVLVVRFSRVVGASIPGTLATVYI
jgi:hypothetical protein